MEDNVKIVAQIAIPEEEVSINATLQINSTRPSDIKGEVMGLIQKMLTGQDIMSTFGLRPIVPSYVKANTEYLNDREYKIYACTEKNDMAKHPATLGPRPNVVPHDKSIHLNIHVQFE